MNVGENVPEQLFQWVKRDREPGAKNLTHLGSQDVGAVNLWVDCVHHEVHA